MSNQLGDRSQYYLDERLHLSVLNGDLEDVLFYLAKGANPNTLDDDFSWSSYSKLPVIFLALGWRSSGNVKMPLDISIIRALLQYGANANCKGFDGITPLLFALSSCQEEASQVLLEYNAEVNVIEDLYERTPLMFAVECEWVLSELLEIIVKKTTNINLQDKNGWTSLMFAAFVDRLSNAQLLLQYGANPHIVNNEGKTALLIAQEEGANDLISLLHPK